MNFVNRLVMVVFVFLAMVATTHAANLREELKQLTAQLQGSPNDNALREKIIKLARSIKPAPVIPAEAERFDGRGEYAFKNAKTEADYLVAAQEFEKATTTAPWVAAYYFNAGTAYEKAQRPKEAKRNFEFYLLASPDARDAREVRRRIAGLEFAIEKENSPQAVAASKLSDFNRWLKSIDNARFETDAGFPPSFMKSVVVYEIRARRATRFTENVSLSSEAFRTGYRQGREESTLSVYEISDSREIIGSGGHLARLSDDGQTIIETIRTRDKTISLVFKRVR